MVGMLHAFSKNHHVGTRKVPPTRRVEREPNRRDAGLARRHRGLGGEDEARAGEMDFLIFERRAHIEDHGRFAAAEGGVELGGSERSEVGSHGDGG